MKTKVEGLTVKNKNILIIFIIIYLPLLLISCSDQKPLKSDTPVNTAIIMESFLKEGNYIKFNELFTDGRKNAVSEEQFNELKKLTTAGTDLKHYELLTFTNGKMILVELTQERTDGEYKIEDVKEVPDEMKSLLK
jgi:hypothetical protein